MPAYPRASLEVVAETGSTNQDLLERARHNAPPAPVVRAAWAQTAGRGRLGRRWYAPVGSALLMSVAVPLRQSILDSAVTLACGVHVVETLRAQGVPADLKWPNDVLLGGRKLAGLLAELATDTFGARTLIVGLGLNLMPAPEGLPHDVPTPAALSDQLALHDWVGAYGFWCAQLTTALLDAISIVDTEGFGPYVPRFNALFVWRGLPVTVIEPQTEGWVERTSGIALGVDTHGHLCLDVGGTMITLTSGDVSLRSTANA